MWILVNIQRFPPDVFLESLCEFDDVLPIISQSEYETLEEELGLVVDAGGSQLLELGLLLGCGFAHRKIRKVRNDVAWDKRDDENSDGEEEEEEQEQESELSGEGVPVGVVIGVVVVAVVIIVIGGIAAVLWTKYSRARRKSRLSKIGERQESEYVEWMYSILIV